MEKKVSLFYHKCGVKAGDGCKEMVIPRLGGSLCCIAEMDVRWEECEGDVITFEGLAHFVGSFVVEDMEVGSNTVGV